MATCWAQGVSGTPTLPARVMNRDTQALLDTGSRVTLLRPELAGATVSEVEKLQTARWREQSSKLQQQKELLNRCSVGVSLLVRRISEPRRRLRRRDREAGRGEIVPLDRSSWPTSPQPGTWGHEAAVGPYRQLPVPGRQKGGYNLPPDPLKPQTRSVHTRPGRPQRLEGGPPTGQGARLPGVEPRGPGAWANGGGVWHPVHH